MKDQKFATKAIHAGQDPEQVTGAVNVPVFLTSTYAQEGIGENRGWEYSRTHNPTRAALEACIAELEGGLRGFAFASGMAALDTLTRLWKPGDHVIAADDMYGGTFRLFDKVTRTYGVEFSFVDASDPANVRAAITDRTVMIYVETPTNPMMKLCDLSAIGSIAQEAGVHLAVDNTFMTPYLQRPIELGASIVLHSSTKYIGGHSDLVGGLLVTSSEELAEQLGFYQNSCGGVASPFDSYLMLRSLKTLTVRMDRHCANAQRVAEFVASNDEFVTVNYPGLESFPQHDLASRQMSGYGGMISADLGSLERARHFCSSVRLFIFAESLGGVESLLCHPATMTHGSIPKETREKLGITDGLVRFSVGIEDVEDLIADIEGALRGIPALSSADVESDA